MTDAQLTTRLARMETEGEIRQLIRYMVRDEKLGDPLVEKIARYVKAGGISRDELAGLLNHIATRRNDRENPITSPGAYLNKCIQGMFKRNQVPGAYGIRERQPA